MLPVFKLDMILVLRMLGAWMFILGARKPVNSKCTAAKDPYRLLPLGFTHNGDYSLFCSLALQE